MPMNALWLKVEPEHVSESLREALQKLDGTEPELALDFSAAHRIDPPALQVLEKLAAKAEQKAVRVVLCGVRVEIYKVLKLMKLTPKFSFR